MATMMIRYEVQRGHTWVVLDDPRWEVKEEAESSNDETGTVEAGGQTYRWSKNAETATDEVEHECAYCHHTVSSLTVPAASDDEAWEALAAEHYDGCEWLATRAHRREDAAAE